MSRGLAITLVLVLLVARVGYGNVLGVMTETKLIVHPLVSRLLVTRVFETDHLCAVVMVIVAGLPTGATGFVLAHRYGVFVARTSSLTLASTLLSVITVFALLSIVKTTVPATWRVVSDPR